MTPEPPAPLAARAGARVVDAVTYAWLVAVLVVETGRWLLGGGPASSPSVAVALLAAAAVVEVVPVAVWGRSLGKALLGVRVVRAGGGPPGAGRSLVRCTVLFGPLAVPVAGWAVGLAIAAVAVLGLHDRLAGTAVVAAWRDAGPRDGLPG